MKSIFQKIRDTRNFQVYMQKKMEEACESGNIELVKSMISLGCEIDEQHLANACKSGNIELVNLILSKREFDADDFAYALESACNSKNIEIIRLIASKECPDYFDAVYYACRVGDIVFAKEMLQKLDEIEPEHGEEFCWDESSCDLFRIAFENSQMGIVKLLADQGSFYATLGLYTAFTENISKKKNIIEILILSLLSYKKKKVFEIIMEHPHIKIEENILKKYIKKINKKNLIILMKISVCSDIHSVIYQFLKIS